MRGIMKLKYGEYKATISIKGSKKCLCELTTWRGDSINKILSSLPIVKISKGDDVNIVIKPAEEGENETT